MRKGLKKRLTFDELAEGIDKQNRIVLSKAITLIESKRPSDQQLADKLIEKILPESGNSIRIGITGVPGVGKSTFIEALGQLLTSEEKRVAVLSIDPSSALSKGSILGDKTRMAALSTDPKAYIRPSATSGALGGVANKTREAILLCEAAGYEIIIVETVGVGQSETSVKDMVDFFLVLMLAGGGDELQGIKRGIMEMADAIVINKADGANIQAAEEAKKAYQNAMHLFPPSPSGWTVPVKTCSSIDNEGIPETWDSISGYVEKTKANGYFSKQRKAQNLKWMHDLIRQKLESAFFDDPAIQSKLKKISQEVAAGEQSVRQAINDLFG